MLPRPSRQITHPKPHKPGVSRQPPACGGQTTLTQVPPTLKSAKLRGASKWNKIEHRLFAQITRNWRGRPLTSHEAVINLIGATATTTGLTVTAQLDTAP